MEEEQVELESLMLILAGLVASQGGEVRVPADALLDVEGDVEFEPRPDEGVLVIKLVT